MPSWLAPVLVVVGAAVLLWLSSLPSPVVHMAVAAVVAGLIAASGLLTARRLAATGASPGRIAGTQAWHIGLVLAWIALVVATTYTLVLRWDEWWQFLIGAGVVAALALLLGRTLESDAGRGTDDAAMLILARFMAWCLLIGGIAAAVGLVADKKMTRFMSGKHTDWAANNTFFFGAIALAVLSWGILSSTRSKISAANVSGSQSSRSRSA